MLAILLGVYTCVTPSKYTIELMRQRTSAQATSEICLNFLQ